MSRRAGLAAFAILLAAPAIAQERPTAPPTGGSVTAEQAIATAKEVYGPPAPKPKCPPQPAGGEIVVCAEQQEQSQFRVQSSGDLDPEGAGARDSIPRAPDLEHHYPGPVVATGCFIPPCPPPMPVLIDLKAIPEAPPGSDADRVAHGLAPRGDGAPPRPPVSAPPNEPPKTGEVTQPGSASPAAGP